MSEDQAETVTVTRPRTIEEQIEQFVSIAASGGVVVAHPDAIADFQREIIVSPLLAAIFKSIGRAVEYVPNQYVAPGTLYAVAKRKPLRVCNGIEAVDTFQGYLEKKYGGFPTARWSQSS